MKRTGKSQKTGKQYTYYCCEFGTSRDEEKKCDFMTWDVPTKDDCPVCGQTMFKKAGKGFKKPFCINPACENFLPEDKRGFVRKKGPQTRKRRRRARRRKRRRRSPPRRKRPQNRREEDCREKDGGEPAAKSAKAAAAKRPPPKRRQRRKRTDASIRHRSGPCRLRGYVAARAARHCGHAL